MLPSLTIMLALTASASPPAEARENLLARGALDALTTRCVQCHGPDVPHPKARFGFVTDLNRLVASERYIVPGMLDKSELWKEIDEGDMPPDEARAGPLTPEEKDAIRRWIVGGAPPLAPAEATGPEADVADLIPPTRPEQPPAPPPGAESRPLFERLIVLIGRLHVLVVHFPIALLLVAASAEARELLRRSTAIPSSVRLCLTLGALAAPGAVALGWIHALDGFAGPLSSPVSTAGLHRWIGTAVGAIAPVVALVSERDVRRGSRSPRVRWAIFALALAVGAAGHFGGLLTHGSGYFDP